MCNSAMFHKANYVLLRFGESFLKVSMKQEYICKVILNYSYSFHRELPRSVQVMQAIEEYILTSNLKNFKLFDRKCCEILVEQLLVVE